MYAALHTRMSTGPRLDSISPTRAATACGSETSAAAGNPPVSATTASIRSSRTRPLTPTVTPSAASRLAMAAPIPCVAPVTKPMRTSDHRAAVRRKHLAGAECGVLADEVADHFGDLLGSGQPACGQRRQVLRCAPG